jgi:hypothetical protein
VGERPGNSSGKYPVANVQVTRRKIRNQDA